MSDQPDPPRKVYGFKPREFERANPARPDASSPDLPAPDPGIAPARDEKIDVQDLIRAGAGIGPALGNNATVNRANDVHAILRQNHAHANATGLNDLKPMPKRRSRRRRDYWLLLAAGNGFMLGAFLVETFVAYQVQCLAAKMPDLAITMFFQFLFHSPALALPAALMAAYSGALTWLMFGQMNDY
jgi:hypothetical protein